MDKADLQEWLRRNPELAVQADVRTRRPAHSADLPENTAVPTYESIAERTVKMKPFGKARPRVTQNGQHTYMPPVYEKMKKTLQGEFGNFEIPELARITVIAIRPLPKSWSKKKRLAMNGKFAAPKPDVDNIIGAVMDALFPEDDDMVVEVSGKKVWGESAAIHIKIESISYVD